MLSVLFLYAAQVMFFVYVFIHGWNLGIVGSLRMVFYSVTAILIGFLASGGG
jgi:hypothetical protein